MALYEIPLTPDNQTFSLRIGDNTLGFRLIFRDAAGWVIDMASAAGDTLIQGLPVLGGVDMLAPYAYLELGVKLFAVSGENVPEHPNATTLGNGSRLLFMT